MPLDALPRVRRRSWVPQTPRCRGFIRSLTGWPHAKGRAVQDQGTRTNATLAGVSADGAGNLALRVNVDPGLEHRVYCKTWPNKAKPSERHGTLLQINHTRL